MKKIMFLVCAFSLVVLRLQAQPAHKILRLEMNLSAFGVESDHVPNISGFIDFEKDSGYCKKSYDNPAYRGSTYTFSAGEIKNILDALQHMRFEQLNTSYTTNRSDQPTSTITVYTDQQSYTVEDYGLRGTDALRKLYGMIYKDEPDIGH